MISKRELLVGFQSLPIRGQAVIAHGSFKAFGGVQGGPQAVVDTLAKVCGALVMPAFTYQTMVTPLAGPPNNAVDYAAEEENRKMGRSSTFDAVPFRSDMPADGEMGILAETLRCSAGARRSFHPILSFTGMNADFALEQQTIFDPLAPIGALAQKDGWVLLMGVDHTVNTSIHYAEKNAGRKQFVRWALTRRRIIECPGFPGDSAGFNEIANYLESDVEMVTIGEAHVQAIQLNRLMDRVHLLLRTNPLALLCERKDCPRCNAVRNSL